MSDIWSHVWEDISPLFDSVMSTGNPTWDDDLTLVMNRSGFAEEIHFTFSYSALRDDDGVVRGIIDISAETTHQVVDRRRLGTLGGLSTAMHGHRDDPRQVVRVAITELTTSEDVAQADLYLGRDLVGSTATEPLPLGPRLDRALHTGEHSWDDGVLVAPLSAGRGGPPRGVLALRGNPRRPYDATHHSFLMLLARAVSTALAEAVEHREKIDHAHTVSDALQRAMVPAPPPSVRWQTRYRPADDTLTVGGDWFDVVPLTDGTSALVVGDCVGHGVEAAAIMGRLSSAGRAMALDGAGPARALGALDVFARTVPGSEFATVFCGIVDPTAGTLTYSSAGHPPALIVRADATVTWLDQAVGPPLTVADGGRPERTIQVGRGDTVLLYTDGLVERRGESLAVGLERLARAAVTACRTTPLAQVPDTLVDMLLDDGASDDIAVVAYRA